LRPQKGHLAIANAKNSIRGALTNSGVNVLAVLSTAIDHVPDEAVAPLGVWIDQFASKKARFYPPRKITAYTDLCPQSSFRLTDLSKSIQWVSRYLVGQRDLIDAFISLRLDLAD
jgi:hypothetical protein